MLLSRPESEAIIKSLPSKVTRTTIVDPAIACPSPTPPDSGQGFRPAQPAATIEVLDGWGKPIRFVHPAFDGGWGPFWNGTALVSTGRDQTKTIAEQRGAQVKNTDYRRSIMPVDPTQPLNLGATGDADESLAAGNRPFWYSGAPMDSRPPRPTTSTPPSPRTRMRPRGSDQPSAAGKSSPDAPIVPA